MNPHYYPDRSFVIHKIKVPGRVWCATGWFAPDGTLRAAETIHWRNGRRSTRPVQYNGPQWRAIAAIGRRWASTSHHVAP